MDTQQKRMLAVSAAAATLGLAAAALGIAAEYFTHKALVRSDGSSRTCEYRRTPALGFGVAAAVLSLAGVILVTAASRCFVGRRDDDVLAAGSDPHERGRCVGKVCAALAWLLAAAAAAMFLYGASWNAGRGRQGSFTAIYRLPGRFFYRCPELRKGFFVSASINAGLGITCAIAAYADLHRRKRNHQTVTLGGVAMGQPSYPPAPVAYPAQPPPAPHPGWSYTAAHRRRLPSRRPATGSGEPGQGSGAARNQYTRREVNPTLRNRTGFSPQTAPPRLLLRPRAMEVQEPFTQSKNPRRARRRDLNALDPSVEESDGEDIGVPEVGMVFNNHAEVNRFYRKYARRVGFGVSVRRSSFSQEGTCLYLELMCCKGGRPRYEPKFRKRASSTTNCPAKIRVKLWGDKLLHVELANLDHNHPVSPAMARFLNSYKQLSGPAKRRMRMGGPGAMPVEEPSKMPMDKLGELEELLFGESKHHSFVERGHLKLQPGDSEALRIFFTRMQARNANFYNVIDMDDEGCMRNVFWADARSRAMYEYYSDVITLDTSYVASKHDMPLATFIGVNHHGQSVLMGCALLSDETAETYSWLLKAWIACMSGNLPKAIVTDYCRGIQSAVAEVIPGVCHRMCLFQIMRKAAERLSGLSEYRAINKAMHKAVYDSLTIDEFEGEWNALITCNGLQGNDWLRSLYECRASWVPVFIKDTFWAGMSVTQRNETITPFFDGYVDLKTTLKQFLGKYEIALQSKYEKEAQADFETFHKQRPPVSKFYMEEQLSKVYTHNMFKKFQDEIEAIMYCHVSLIGVDGPISTFNVKECIFLEDGKRTMSTIFTVTYNADEKDITCICGGFQFSGILCRHSLSTLKFQLVREIPPQYILDRWKKDFRQLHVLGRPPSDLVPNNRVDRYDYLSMRCLQLVDSAVLSDKYRLALRLVREMEKFLLNSNTHDDTQPRIKSRIPKVNKPNPVTGQNVGDAATVNGNGGSKGPEPPAVMQASQIQKGGAERGIVPAGYIGVPANVQQFVANQAAIRPSIVYMVPSGVDPHAFGNGVLMPVMYQQMFQVPQKPNGTVQDTSANGKKKRPRGQKLTESSQLSNGTPGPSSG